MLSEPAKCGQCELKSSHRISACLGLRTGGGAEFVCRSIRISQVSWKNVIKSYVSWDSDLMTHLQFRVAPS